MTRNSKSFERSREPPLLSLYPFQNSILFGAQHCPEEKEERRLQRVLRFRKEHFFTNTDDQNEKRHNKAAYRNLKLNLRSFLWQWTRSYCFNRARSQGCNVSAVDIICAEKKLSDAEQLQLRTSGWHVEAKKLWRNCGKPMTRRRRKNESLIFKMKMQPQKNQRRL